MPRRDFVARDKKFDVDGVEVWFHPWDDDDYFCAFKSSDFDDSELETENVDVFVRGSNFRASYYKQFQKLSDSAYTQFIEKFLADFQYRCNFLTDGENWTGELKVLGEEKPLIHPKCASEIKRIENTQDDRLKFRDFANLKTFGMDFFSRKKIPELEKILDESQVVVIKSDARMSDTTLYTSALKWCARGLSANHAVRKVMTDKEISDNSRGVRVC